jgi:hypothetical protein
MTAQIRRLRQLALLASVAIALGCGGSLTAAETDLSRAKLAWDARGPRSYDVTVAQSCFCVYETPGPVVVSVRDGVVESRRYVQTGAPVSATFVSAYPSVTELFALIDRAIAAKSERVDLKFDPALGYPLEVAIDHQLNTADDEVYYSVSDFVPR